MKFKYGANYEIENHWGLEPSTVHSLHKGASMNFISQQNRGKISEQNTPLFYPCQNRE